MSIEQEAREFETQTGIAFPTCLIDLYQKNGNGGFGPDYGFIGILSGHKTDLEDSILSLYKSFRSEDSDDPNWFWPKDYIPFIHIGCGIHYCIDASDGNSRVIEFDPTDYDTEVGPEPHFKILAPSFSEWLVKNE